MTQRDLMLARLREAEGRVVPINDLAEHVFAGQVPGPKYPREQLGAIGSQLRRRGHHVELVQGMGWRLIEAAR